MPLAVLLAAAVAGLALPEATEAAIPLEVMEDRVLQTPLPERVLLGLVVAVEAQLAHRVLVALVAVERLALLLLLVHLILVVAVEHLPARQRAATVGPASSSSATRSDNHHERNK